MQITYVRRMVYAIDSLIFMAVFLVFFCGFFLEILTLNIFCKQ